MRIADRFRTNNRQNSSTINHTPTADPLPEKQEVTITPAMRQVLDKLFSTRNQEKGRPFGTRNISGRGALTERNSPYARIDPSPRAKKQRFSEIHQVYANPREEPQPLVERQRSYIKYARQKLQLD